MNDEIARLLGGTHALIDLDAYQRNIALLRSRAQGAACMAVIKADAYGHGAVACARAAVAAGCDWLGVARIEEALLLRREGIDAPLLVLGPPNAARLDQALRAGIALAVGSAASFDAVVQTAARIGEPARVHVKVDTGMHRYGFSVEEAVEVVERLSRNPFITVDGVFTHFARADETDLAPTDEQARRFAAVIARLRERCLLPRWVHQANSAGILTGRFAGTNLVRAGIAAYGLSPSDECRVDAEFRPVLSLRSVIGRRFTLQPGAGVAYGWTYVAERAEEVAVVPVGYADGLPRQLANTGWFVVGGERAPIRGRVCMDQTIVGVPDDAREGDLVTVYGTDGAMTLDDIAAIAGTNAYEIATRVMPRVPRIYLRNGQPVAWEHLLLAARGAGCTEENDAGE